jgi:hypothetical protein
MRKGRIGRSWRRLKTEQQMSISKITTVGVFALAISMTACSSPGVAAGAATGAAGGAVVGGPPGAVVGAAGGAIVGGIADANSTRFRTYVVEQHTPSYAYTGDVVVGVVLPDSGVTYYDVPPDYNVPTYKYTVVNDHVVLVDPSTRRIVQVIN